MRVLFSNVLVAGRDGGSSNSIPIPTETNQLSNGIPQCIFIIIIIFIVPCLTIIHGYKQSFSICFSSCVGVWVCVWFNVFIISLSRTNSRHPRILVFVFPLLPCLHEWLSNFLYEFLSFIFFQHWRRLINHHFFFDLLNLLPWVNNAY